VAARRRFYASIRDELLLSWICCRSLRTRDSILLHEQIHYMRVFINTWCSGTSHIPGGSLPRSHSWGTAGVRRWRIHVRHVRRDAFGGGACDEAKARCTAIGKSRVGLGWLWSSSRCRCLRHGGPVVRLGNVRSFCRGRSMGRCGPRVLPVPSTRPCVWRVGAGSLYPLPIFKETVGKVTKARGGQMRCGATPLSARSRRFLAVYGLQHIFLGVYSPSDGFFGAMRTNFPDTGGSGALPDSGTCWLPSHPPLLRPTCPPVNPHHATTRRSYAAWGGPPLRVPKTLPLHRPGGAPHFHTLFPPPPPPQPMPPAGATSPRLGSIRLWFPSPLCHPAGVFRFPLFFPNRPGRSPFPPPSGTLALSSGSRVSDSPGPGKQDSDSPI